MSYKKQPIGIVLVTAIASLLLAGMILAPTQASALSKFNTNTDTSNLKHGIRDGVSVNLEHRDQHMNQENLCYRTNTCRQSNAGQNTLGNDNSVTGFADQSDNIQQSAAVPTTTTTAPVNQTTGNQTRGNNTTPTPTPTPTPIPIACPAGTAFDLSLTGTLEIPGIVTLPTGTVLCVNPTGIVLAEILPSGTVLSVPVVFDGQPTGPAPGVCPAGNVVAVVASGTVPTTLPTTIVIGPLGVCVHL